MTSPLIVGLSGHHLTPHESRFLEAVRPLGIIVFARNVASAEQLTDLVAEAKAAAGADFAFVDQEGGRVQRLRPPLAPRYPPAASIGAVYRADRKAGERAAWLLGRLIAADIAPFGFSSPCLPVADVTGEGSHDVIGDRAFGHDEESVAVLAGAAAEGVLDGGCWPIIKHMPGHGKATVDSHLTLPDVAASREALGADFAPFRRLAALPMGMTAHVRYAAIDKTAPATLSQTVVALIREEIGFDGLLMTDDISMGALRGSVAENARRALEVGCDIVLHCNGKLREMEAIAGVLPPLTAAATRRIDAVRAARRTPSGDDIDALRQEFASLLAVAA